MTVYYSSRGTKYQRKGTKGQLTELFIFLSGGATSIKSDKNKELILGEALTELKQVLSTPQFL